jgi:hypothetical protein
MPGQALAIDLTVDAPISAATLYYRHVNQAERFNFMPLIGEGRRYQATIPAEYTDSFYPLEYYFELTQPDGVLRLYPGFTKDLTNQPYFVVGSGPKDRH